MTYTSAAGDKRPKVGMGVTGDPAYGNARPAQRSQWASINVAPLSMRGLALC
ncbi:MAG: hypothetical protein H0X08_08980 [Blastocatellia bacterium]|nr:hypothetical protein [Blastocatellia bacterium]